MKNVLIAAAFAGAFAAAGCKPPKPEAAQPAAVPAAESPMEKNRAEKYVSELHAEVKRAQEAKEKADAAAKRAEEAQKSPE